MNSEVIITLIAIILFVLGFTGLGGAILQRAGLVTDSALTWWPAAAALGFAVISYLGYGLAWMAPVSAVLVVTLLLGSALIGWTYLRQLASELFALARTSRPGLVDWLLIGLALVFLALIFINALSPVKEGDALQGYMFTARWLAHEGLTFNPYNPRFSLFPLNTEMVMALSYPFGTDLIAKSLDIVMGLFFAGSVFGLARRFTNTKLAALAALSLVTIPEFINNWGSGKIDNTASFIFFAGIALLLRAEANFVSLSVAAFLLGTACAQKYSFWIFALTLPVLVVYGWRNETRARQFQAIIWAGAIVLICLLPHFAKNLRWTNNPIAPFAQQLFPSKNIYLAHTSDATKTSLSTAWSLPDTLFFEDLAKRGSGRLPLLLLPGLLALLWAKRQAPLLFGIAAIALLQLIVWIAVRQTDWLVPRFMLAPLALLLVAGAWAIGELIKPYAWGQFIACGLLGILLLWPGIWMHRHWRESLRFVLGRESRAAWQDRVVPARAHNALVKIAERLDANHRLMLGSELYQVPESKLPFVCTEKELAEFADLSGEARLEYLRNHGFAFYYRTASSPVWLQGLPVVAEVQPKDPGALRFKIYQTLPTD